MVATWEPHLQPESPNATRHKPHNKRIASEQGMALQDLCASPSVSFLPLPLRVIKMTKCFSGTQFEVTLKELFGLKKGK